MRIQTPDLDRTNTATAKSYIAVAVYFVLMFTVVLLKWRV